MKVRKLPIIRWATLIGTTMLTAPALAQNSSPTGAPAEAEAAQSNAGWIDDIVVTAQKRSQAINDVGVTITAVTGDDLVRRGVNDAADLVKVVPGLTFTPTAYNTPVYTLRGIGFFENSLAAAPAVSVYIDEVPLAFPAMTQGASLDVARVEVLKGPQGTLYGQNSTGGAINYIAAKPTTTWQTGFDVGFGRFASADFGGYVSGPLSDTLGIRVAGRSIQGGNWQRSATRDDMLGQTDKLIGRILLDWAPTDTLKLELNVNGWRDQSDTLAGQVILVQPLKPSLATSNLRTNYPIKDLNARVADWTPGKKFQANDSFYNISLRGDLELGRGMTLTSISAYQHLRQNKLSDTDGTNEPGVDVLALGKIDAASQEIRIAGEAGPVTWLVGGNYAYSTIDDDQPTDVSSATGDQPVPTIPRFASLRPVSHSRIESLAGFGNVEVKLARGLTLIAGLRYTDVRNHYQGCTIAGDANSAAAFNAIQANLKAASGLTSPIVPVTPGSCLTLISADRGPSGITNPTTAFNPGQLDQHLNESNWSIRGGLNYKTPGGALLYASFNRGYKAGGFSVLIATNTRALEPATQERVNAYEAGIKVPLFNRRVQLNGAGFYYAYANKQIRGKILDPNFGLLGKLINVPKSRVLGAELEIQAQPIDGLELSASGTYVDTKVQQYSGYDLGSVLINLSGTRFPWTPKFTAVGDAQYTWAVDSSRDVFIGASARHASSSYASFLPITTTRLRPYTLIDLRAGIEDRDGAWRLSVWGRNVTNEYYWNNVFRSQDTWFRQPAKPVTYGATFSARFE